MRLKKKSSLVSCSIASALLCLTGGVIYGYCPPFCFYAGSPPWIIVDRHGCRLPIVARVLLQTGHWHHNDKYEAGESEEPIHLAGGPTD
jgi:hypothetical protein